MKYLFVSFLVCMSVTAFAQQNHFIYIQTDNKQPFYVKLDKKILSSSASGYLIIPKLQDSTYELSIGFPKNEWPEQKVTCGVNNKDAGYLLKNFGEKGWGLFNFQTMDLVMADSKPTTDSAKIKETKSDAFTDALSNVVNDPNIKVVEEVKKDSIAATPPVKKAIAKTTKIPAVKSKDKAVVFIKKDRIAKILSRKNADSLRMVYVDRVKGQTDTINIVIPAEKPVVKVQPEKKKPTAAKLIVATKKPGKKITVSKADLAKNTAKNIPVVDSTSVVPVIKTEEPKVDIVKADNKNQDIAIDTAAIMQPGKKIEELKTDIVKADTVNNNKIDSAVTTKAELPKTDTVKTAPAIITPAIDTMATVKTETKVEEPKPVLVKETPKEPVIQPVDSTIKTAVVLVDSSASKVMAEPVAVVKKADDRVVTEKPKENVIEKPIANGAVINRVCTYVADGDEFLNLKKKMSKSKSDNEMLYHAHQLFLKRCFTTKQIERLSLLFNNDLGKYNLFDDAYHYIIDPENFASLQTLLTDDYYIKRFKAMIR